jgi:SAM-dependent methyltransferase
MFDQPQVRPNGSTAPTGTVVAVDCPICGNDRVTRLPFESDQSIGRFPILQCETCSHRYIGDGPSDELLRRHYNDSYAVDARQARPVRPAVRDFALVRRTVPRLSERASLLEIGCNFGQTLRAFPRTYDLHGVDVSATALRGVADDSRLKIHVGFFEEMDFADGSFDAVLALALIEHIRHPTMLLSRIARVLRPGGTLLLMTGDYMAWNARRMGANWHLYHSDGHFHFFSQASLSRALRNAGFTVEDSIWAGPNPVTARLPNPVGRLLHCQTTSLLVPGLFGRKQYGDIVYMWSRKTGN